jgi:hypothetical protein
MKAGLPEEDTQTTCPSPDPGKFMTDVRDDIVLAGAGHGCQHSSVESRREPTDSKSGGSIEQQPSSGSFGESTRAPAAHCRL